MASDIVVRIGAAIDRSFDVVMGEVRKKTEQLQRATAKAIGGNSGGDQYGPGRREFAKSVAQREQLQRASDRKMLAEAAAVEKQKTANVLREAKARAAAEAALQRQRSAGLYAQHREAERAEEAHRARLSRADIVAARRRDREVDRFANRTSHRATRFFFPPPEGALGYAKRIGTDLARGAGVDMTLSGSMARARERETAGMGLAQQERIATGTTKGGAYWSGISTKVGAELSTDPAQVTEMMRAFTGKTGDFEAAANQAKELASMTMAAGANMDEMGSAAGYVYNQLKGMPGAAEMTLTVMRGIVGQTAVGAVEMEEYAKQMGRIAANAKMFEGNVDKNILELSALTQLSIAEGGATSGADAARSIAAFANTTSKGQRINAFKKFGVSLFNEEGTQKRPMMEIIKDSLIASKGNIPAMTQMWADTLGQKPIRGLANAFNAAGGGEAGWKAAEAKIKPFMEAQLSKETEKQNVEAYQATTTAKAAKFQNQLDAIAERTLPQLVTTLEKAAPIVLSATQKFASALEWAVDNPIKTFGLAIVAAVGRAGIESGIRTIIDRAASNIFGSVAGGAVPGMAGGAQSMGQMFAGKGVITGAATGVGVAAMLAGTALAAYSLTTALLEAADASKQKAQQDRAKTYNDITAEGTGGIAGAGDMLGVEQSYQRAKRDILAADLAKTGNSNPSAEATASLKKIEEAYAERTTRASKGAANAKAAGIDVAPGQGITEASMLRAFTQALTGQPLSVQVRNFDEMPGSGGMSMDPGRPGESFFGESKSPYR